MFAFSPFLSTTHRRRASALALVALFAALSATALLPRVASAITKIKEVRVAADAEGEGAGEAFLVEEGAESVYVLFDYSGASRNSQVAVQVVGLSVELFRQEDRYDGDGTAAVEITGDAMYATIAASLEELAAVLLASSNQVQRTNVSAGQLDNDLNVMIGRANAGSITVPLLEKIDDSSVLESVARLDKALGRLSNTLDDARSFAYDEVGQRQSALTSTADDARELEGLAEDIATELQDLQNLPLPVMGSQWSFDVSVRVTEGSQQDIAAGDALFYVVSGSQPSDLLGSGEPEATATARRDLIGQGSTARSTRTPPATAASSGSQPTATTAKSAGADGDGDESGAGGDETAGESDPGVRSSATPRPGATSAPVSESEDAGESPLGGAPESEAPEDEDETEPEADSGAGGQEPPVASGSESGSSETSGNGVDAPPTWTPAAGLISEAGEDGDPGESGGGGPNRAVLLLGLLVLVGAGLWFRRRL